MKIYISGPMSGIHNLNKPAFDQAALELRGCGYHVASPATLGLGPEVAWEECLRQALAQMLQCEGVATLPTWGHSRGMTLELSVAQQVALPIAPVGSWVLDRARFVAPPPAS